MLRAGSLAGALVVSAGVALAAPANADADGFIRSLQDDGISYISEQDALDSGFAVCNKMHDGQNLDSVTNDVRVSGTFTSFAPNPSRPEWAAEEADVILQASSELCPDTADAIFDWMFANTFTNYGEIKQENPDIVRELVALACSDPEDDSEAADSICHARDWGEPPSAERVSELANAICDRNVGTCLLFALGMF